VERALTDELEAMADRHNKLVRGLAVTGGEADRGGGRRFLVSNCVLSRFCHGHAYPILQDLKK
jgi:hypothetical protein